MAAPSAVVGSIVRRRRGHVERDAVVVGQHRQRRRCRSCWPRRRWPRCGRRRRRRGRPRPPPSSDAGHDVGDQRARDAEPVELPRGEPGALQHRPGLVHPHRRSPALLVRGADHAERRAVADARQRPGVAVREHPAAVGHQRRRRAPRAAGCASTSSSAMRMRLGHRVGGGQRPVDAPRQVHRGRSGGDQRGRGASSSDSPRDARQRHAHRARRTECRRPADRERRR